VALPPHPNAPRRRHLALAFCGIVLAGVLGGLTGHGIVDSSCSETPTVASSLLEAVPGYDVDPASCAPALLAGAAAGSLAAAVGAGIVASLMLRAQSEWRPHPPSGAREPRDRRVRRGGSGGTPPRR
jgi:hypothetical protein